MRAPRNVGERLVYGDALGGRREIAQDCDGGIAEPLVFVEMAADKHEVGTELPRTPSRHAASYAEGPRLVRGREHDAAADRNRLAAQARVKQLFDRRIKGVEVRVENGGCRNHLVDSSAWSSASHPLHPPQRRRESRLVEWRSESQAQRHWSASGNQALQLRRQYPQAIEGGEGENLTTCGHWTAIARWDRWRCVCVHCRAQRDLALLDHDEPRTTVAGLAPHQARVGQPRQPDRAAPGECCTQREPLERQLHELRGPYRQSTPGFVGIVFINIAASPTFSP